MFGALILSAALVFTESDADFALQCASNLVARCTPRDAGTISGHLAANWILDTASMSGVDVRRDRFKAPAAVGARTVDRSFTNLYSMFRRNPTAPWVVFVSHYDTKPGVNCPGANDGASTTGLLIALSAAIGERGYDGGANVMMVWLDGEECQGAHFGENNGLWGSRRAAAEFVRRGLDVRAVVCLDMLGDARLDVMVPSNGSAELRKRVSEAAAKVGVPCACVADAVIDDHVPFVEAGYPAVDLIDFCYGSRPGLNDWWHTPQDTVDKLSRDSLLKAGRLATELVNVLAK